MLSVVVCTYNRSEILKECLESCVSNYTASYPVELIVVDNNSNDSTAKIVRELSENHPWIRYVFSKKQGLSHARNIGYKSASYDWILYLDDDAIVHKDFFDRVKYLIETPGYPCVGGLYLPWYKYGKPSWYKDNLASNKNMHKTLTVLKKNEYACGAVFLIQKALLKKYNGFNSGLGMNGTNVAYGEEEELQRRIRNAGIEIAYDPLLVIYHLVPEYKMDIRWHLRSSFIMGKTFFQARGYPHSKITGLISFGIGIAQFLLHCLFYAPMFFKGNYYVENYIIDVLKKPLKWFGVFRSTWP